MAKLPEEIAETFLAKVTESPDVTPEMVENLRALLSTKKKPKVDELVKVFAPPTGGEVK